MTWLRIKYTFKQTHGGGLSMSTSPKKGVFDFRELSRRFTDFAKVYTPFFDAFSDNVSAQARCYLSGLLMKSPRKNMERMEETVA